MGLQGATYTAQALPPGQAGTIQTLALMAKYVQQSQTDLGLIDFANSILAAYKIPAHNDEAKINAIFCYVKSAVTFRKDPYDAELVKDPRRTLQSGYGDCDDIATVLAALLACVGECPRFAVMKMSKSSPTWEHVYAEVQLGDKWMSLDPTRNPKQGKTYPGWESFYGDKAIYTIFQDGLPPTVGAASWSKFARKFTMGKLGDDYDWFDGGDFSDSGDYSDPLDVGWDPSWGMAGDDGSGGAGQSGDSFDFGWDPSWGAIGDADATGQYTNPLGVTDFYEADGSYTVYSPDGSYENWDANGNVSSLSEVNPDGSITYYDVRSGTSYTEDPYGNVSNQRAATPQQQAKAQAVQKAGPGANSNGGGGGGSGFSLPSGGSGAQKAQAAASSTNSATSLLNSITKAVQGVVGAVTGNPYPSNLTPQQAAALRLQSGNGQLNAGLSLSPTTLLLIGLGIYLVTKK